MGFHMDYEARSRFLRAADLNNKLIFFPLFFSSHPLSSTFSISAHESLPADVFTQITMPGADSLEQHLHS